MIFWYISRDIVEALKQETATASFLQSIALSSFKLNSSPGDIGVSAEAEVGLQANDKLFKDLKQVTRKILLQHEVKEFQDLQENSPPVYFSFRALAVRLLKISYDDPRVAYEDTYLVAMKRYESALLLAGARRHAIGNIAESKAKFSPSADPVAAIADAFRPRVDTDLLSSSISYVWEEIMNDALSEQVAFPRVYGIAIFASMFKAAMIDSDLQHLERIVVGSPIFIEQVVRPRL